MADEDVKSEIVVEGSSNREGKLVSRLNEYFPGVGSQGFQDKELGAKLRRALDNPNGEEAQQMWDLVNYSKLYKTAYGVDYIEEFLDEDERTSEEINELIKDGMLNFKYIHNENGDLIFAHDPTVSNKRWGDDGEKIPVLDPTATVNTPNLSEADLEIIGGELAADVTKLFAEGEIVAYALEYKDGSEQEKIASELASKLNEKFDLVPTGINNFYFEGADDNDVVQEVQVRLISPDGKGTVNHVLKSPSGELMQKIMDIITEEDMEDTMAIDPSKLETVLGLMRTEQTKENYFEDRRVAYKLKPKSTEEAEA